MKSLRQLFTLCVPVLALLSGWLSVADAARLYWVERNLPVYKIQRTNLDGTGLETLAQHFTILGGLNPFGLAVDPIGEKMYWIVEPTTNKWAIMRANLEIPAGETASTRTDVEVVLPLAAVAREIALDVPAGKMYWAGLNTIGRADLSGSNPEVVVSLSNGSREGIALDLVARKVYWTNLNGTISRVNMDGTNLQQLLSGLSDPSGIDLDVAGGKMYWVDFGTDSIHHANLDGTSPQVAFSTGGENPRKIALDVAGGKMYWTQGIAGGSVRRANLDGTGAEDLATELAWPFDIAIEFDAAPTDDADGDGVLDGDDNCPTVANPGQEDTNGDGFGDACVDTSANINSSAVIDSTAVIGSGSTINKNVVVEEYVVLGENVTANRNVVIGAGTTIGNNVVLNQNVMIGTDVRIGNNVTIGRNVVIEDGVTIGNDTIINQGVYICSYNMSSSNLTIGSVVTIGKNRLVDDDVPDGIVWNSTNMTPNPSDCPAAP